MIGKRLGNWMVDREIGRGGMGTVYLAHELPTQNAFPNRPRVAAIKVLSAALAQEPGFVVRFQREVDALRQLHHPNVIEFYESGEHSGYHYAVTEYVEGTSFDDMIEERSRLPWEDVLDYAIQISLALKHAHDHGIIHRDLKPSNLILSRDGVVKLLDFGIAKVFADRPLTATNAVVGTVEYLSPEQAAGKPVTRRSDLYSLGVVLYQLITGRMPFDASSTVEMLHKHRYARFDPPRRWVPELPHDFDSLICKLLAKEPEDRPTDAAFVGKTLDRLQRQIGKKTQNTTDEVRPTGTQVGTQVADPNASAKVRGKLRDPEARQTGDTSKARIRQAATIALLLLAAGAVLAWGLWPDSPEKQLGRINVLIERGDLAEASQRLEQLLSTSGASLDGAQVDAMRREIAAQNARRESRQRQGDTGAKPLPPSPAERAYKAGLQALWDGKTSEAREQWQRVVDAFDGVDAEAPWVSLAREALVTPPADPAEIESVREAIKLAKGAKKDQGLARLHALRDLYAARSDPVGQKAKDLITEALQEANGK